MILESLPEELEEAKRLLREGKYKEALGTIKTFEDKSGISDENKLSALILKGRLYNYIGKYRKAVKVGDIAYNISQKLGRVSQTIEALLIKSIIYLLGDTDKALDIALEAESLIDSVENETSSELLRQRAAVLFTKAYVYEEKGDPDKGLEPALLSLSFRERLGKKMSIASSFLQIGYLYYGKVEYDIALGYVTKSLELQKEINNPTGIASSLVLIARIHLNKGNLDQALQLLNQALGIKDIGEIDKFHLNCYMGIIYRLKGELDLALKYYKQADALSEMMNYKHSNVGTNWINIGSIYRMKGDYDKATEFLKRTQFPMSLFWLVLINIDRNNPEEADQYLSRLEKNSSETQLYRLAKAIVLKASGRSRNRAEAEAILKEITEGEFGFEIYILSLVSLCEYLLEELESSNDPSVLDEINPVITRLLKIAENQHSYSILAETNLLQGRLALMTLNLNDARQFLTTAQKIADEHGLTLLAQKISQEHDTLLEELETWQSFKKTKASMSKRMKLAAVDGVMERMLGKRAVEAPTILEEKPIMLLIMDNSGNTFFTHAFEKDWDYDDLFSSFMSAFNTFSSEIFSKSIDRIKIDENIILANPIDPFLVCYVIKGQSYSALKKLNEFSEIIRNKPEIWDSLQKSIITSEMLDLNNPPSLGAAVDEIFPK